MRRLAAVAVLLLALGPTLAVAGLALFGAGTSEAALGARQAGLLGRSVGIAALATLLALGWGTVTALAVRSLRGAAGAVLEAACLVPLLVPSIVVVMGWVYLLGPAGPFGDLAAALDSFRPGWAALVASLVYFPFVTVLLLQGLRSIDPSWIAVARLTASPARTAWTILRPLLTPYLATAALLVFLLALGDYGIAWALSVNVYPVEIFAQLSAAYDLPGALAYSVPPLVLSIALVAGRFALIPLGHGAVGHARRPYDARPPRVWIAPGLAVLAIAVALPLLVLVQTLGGLDAFDEALRVAGKNALLSLEVAGIATALLVIGGAVVAWGLGAGRDTTARRGRLARTLGPVAVLLPLVVPGAIVGLGIVWLYGQGVVPRALFRSPLILAIGLFCRLLSFPAIILLSARAELRPAMLQAAAVSGASRARTAWRITTPLLAPGLLAAATLSFVLALGELSASSVISPPGLMTLSMRISSLLHFGEDRIVAGLALTLAALVLGAFALGALVLNRRLELHVDGGGS